MSAINYNELFDPKPKHLVPPNETAVSDKSGDKDALFKAAGLLVILNYLSHVTHPLLVDPVGPNTNDKSQLKLIEELLAALKKLEHDFDSGNLTACIKDIKNIASLFKQLGEAIKSDVPDLGAMAKDLEKFVNDLKSLNFTKALEDFKNLKQDLSKLVQDFFGSSSQSPNLVELERILKHFIQVLKSFQSAYHDFEKGKYGQMLGDFQTALKKIMALFKEITGHVPAYLKEVYDMVGDIKNIGEEIGKSGADLDSILVDLQNILYDITEYKDPSDLFNKMKGELEDIKENGEKIISKSCNFMQNLEKLSEYFHINL